MTWSESVHLPLISDNDSWVRSQWPRLRDPGVYGLSLVLHLPTRGFPPGTSGLTPPPLRKAQNSKFQLDLDVADKEPLHECATIVF